MLVKSFLKKIKKRRKIVGRGISAGQGKSCGRGQKGQGARKGGLPRAGFEGGQTPIYRRLPKRGQNKKKNELTKKKNPKVINLDFFQRNEKIIDKQLVDLTEKKIKVLGGEAVLTKKLFIKAFAFTNSAKAKIIQAGGSWEVVNQ